MYFIINHLGISLKGKNKKNKGKIILAARLSEFKMNYGTDESISWQVTTGGG